MDIVVDVVAVVCRLATEQEVLAARSRAEEFEKENCDLVHMLTLKEQELDLRTQEKVPLIPIIAARNPGASVSAPQALGWSPFRISIR